MTEFVEIRQQYFTTLNIAVHDAIYVDKTCTPLQNYTANSFLKETLSKLGVLLLSRRE